MSVALRQIQGEIREIHGNGSKPNFIMLSEVLPALDALLEKARGTVKLVYLDPPTFGDDAGQIRLRAGEQDWAKGRNSFELRLNEPPLEREAYLQLMRSVLLRCRDLLREDGMIWLHTDYHINAYLRILLDEVFGEQNFLNEIVWVYTAGGRSTRHFGRKHDTLFFYRKSKAYDFNIDAVKVVPEIPPSNHMRRHVDADGRVYRSITGGGKTYTYYDDEPLAPDDVWNDCNYTQQKDYESQKPLKLLQRIIGSCTKEGELVLDPFAGSGTALDAAWRMKRNIIGIDRCAATLNMSRRRLTNAEYEIQFGTSDAPSEEKLESERFVGFEQIRLDDFRLLANADGDRLSGMDAIDNWSVGYLSGDAYQICSETFRSRKNPALIRELHLPILKGMPVVCLNDVTGRSFMYEIMLT